MLYPLGIGDSSNYAYFGGSAAVPTVFLMPPMITSEFGVLLYPFGIGDSFVNLGGLVPEVTVYFIPSIIAPDAGDGPLISLLYFGGSIIVPTVFLTPPITTSDDG